MRRNFFLFLIVACIPPEAGIDNTRVVGSVSIGPVLTSELDEAGNDRLLTAEILPDLYVGTQILSGTMVDPSGPVPDVDAFSISSRLTLPDAAFTLTLADPNASVLAELYDLDLGLVLGAVDVQGGATLGFPDFEPDTGFLGDSGIAAGPRMIKGVTYGIRLTATGGAADFAYELVMPGADPSSVDFLVGAYAEPDPQNRGSLLAGSDVVGWQGGQAADDYVWTGRYSMYLVRTVTGEGNDLKVEEGPPPNAWVFAGDFSTLNAALISGTFYSGTPAEVKFPKGEEPRSTFFADAVIVEVPDVVVVDTVAEAIIVQTFDEGDTEPNGLEPFWPPAADLSTAGDAVDVGVLSGPGFADLFTGTITYGPGGYGYVHDTDAFKFRVPERSRLAMGGTWDDGNACLDVYIIDSVDGAALDYAAAYTQPEVGGGTTIYEPDTDYYLLMLGYFGVPEGGSTDYQLLLEQLPP